MRRWLVGLVLAIALVASWASLYALGYEAGSRANITNEQRALEDAFARTMSGATLNGSFTVDGKSEGAPRTERYTIDRVERVAGDVWLFHARIEYGERDVTVPVPVRIQWAGDTPVVTLTDATIPGLGTFTARVLFYRGHYAGMWSNPSVGGLQFGTYTTEN